MLFGKKKKKTAIFGEHIEPNCSWCLKNVAKENEKPQCMFGKTIVEGQCGKFVYDPLMRTPQPAPAFKKDRYSEEDFKL